jgi:prophage maintenance system killer protein
MVDDAGQLVHYQEPSIVFEVVAAMFDYCANQHVEADLNRKTALNMLL